MKQAIVLLLTMLFASACSNLHERPLTLEEHLQKRELTKDEPVKRINRFMLSNYHYIDARHMIVHVGVSRQYLLEFAFDCHDLEHAQVIEVQAQGPGLSTLDKMSARSASGSQVRCPIKTIYPLLPADTANSKDG